MGIRVDISGNFENAGEMLAFFELLANAGLKAEAKGLSFTQQPKAETRIPVPVEDWNDAEPCEEPEIDEKAETKEVVEKMKRAGRKPKAATTPEPGRIPAGDVIQGTQSLPEKVRHADLINPEHPKSSAKYGAAAAAAERETEVQTAVDPLSPAPAELVAPSSITTEMVHEKASAVIKAGAQMPELVEVMQKYGVERIFQLKAEDLPRAYADFVAIGDKYAQANVL